MGETLDSVAEAGLQFFGKMTASASHEIKNVLAIINENAGLLDDIALMADRGKAIEPERLKSLSRAVVKQIRRADSIIQNMNRFAHSADETIESVDLQGLLELVVVLADRLASMRSVTLEPKLQQAAVEIRTSPFLLMNLIWLCLEFAMYAAGDEKIIELTVQKTEAGAQIRIQPLTGLAQVSSDTFPTERENNLLDRLGAELLVGAKNNEFIINLKQDIDKG
jgi:C4-dicarboxylate-specific signal transduction histidine kinase